MLVKQRRLQLFAPSSFAYIALHELQFIVRLLFAAHEL